MMATQAHRQRKRKPNYQTYLVSTKMEKNFLHQRSAIFFLPSYLTRPLEPVQWANQKITSFHVRELRMGRTRSSLTAEKRTVDFVNDIFTVNKV
jgi:hypothetical protein